MSVHAVESYLSDGYEKIEGWLSPHILRIVGHLGEEMNNIGVVGGACEIGVYQGRFMVGLTHVVDGRRSLAIDIFDNQEYNIDGSGAGSGDLLARFRQNVAAYGCGDVGELSADSLALTSEDGRDIVNKYGQFQFVSIDGGHEPEHVISDYHFAESIIHPGGAMIIDDILNAGWPGVMEGVAVLFLLGRPKFVPFAIGHNKLFLVSKSFHARYLGLMRKRLKEQMPDKRFWKKTLFGHEIIVVL